MKKHIIYAFLGMMSLAATTLTSCDDFLDNQPENQQTMDDVFQTRNATLNFLGNVYSYIRMPNWWSNGNVFAGACDEIDVTYAEYEISKINLGMLAPDKEGDSYGNYWRHYYRGIRAATYFLEHIDENPELEAWEITKTKCEARALRAYYYLRLVQQYGPVVLFGDDPLISATSPTGDMQLMRSTASECFDYIVKECDEVIKIGGLANFRDDKIEYGRVTNCTVLGIKARALLSAASPLYNQDETLEVFKDLKNPDGRKLMDYTNSGRLYSDNADNRKARWEKAAAACKAVMDYPGPSLYKNGSDPVQIYRNIFMDEWNAEVIWARPFNEGFHEPQLAPSPRFVNGWAGWGTTQEMVDAFFTSTGYPVKLRETGKLDDAGNPVYEGYADDGSYTESGFSNMQQDNGYTEAGTFKMYCNREPRFYATITFDNMKYLAKSNPAMVEFWYGGNTGRTINENRNYSQTGYLPNKFIDAQTNPNTGTYITHSQILMRYAEFVLGYAEALNEVDYAANLNEVLATIKTIRDRISLPSYGSGNREVPVPKDQAAMREAIQHERQVELCFEDYRFLDGCRWLIAPQKFGGPMHGMNVQDTRGKSHFYERTVFETRIFPDYACLWPIPMSDIYKDKNLVQNPKWSEISSSTMDDGYGVDGSGN